jgi:glutamyl-tRNA synthetase
MTTRTRFAPSPTGYLHVGSVRTALFAWLVARQAGGQVILRLEDTDKTREVEGSIQNIMDSLKWLGINWDEGIDVGGPYGPYKQSERLSIYKEWAQKLTDKGRAYADPYTVAQVNELRERAKAAKQPFFYRNYRPENPPAWDGSQPLRFKSVPKAYDWHDEVMGDLSVGEEAIDDFVLIKSDGFPTYNFAHIVDDFLMQISHVIRSQEFIASVPRYLNLYEALEIERPMLATLPYVMGPDGNKKLGKRDRAESVLDYAHEGFLPEALVSFMATLGWNDGTKKEVFTVQELIDNFSLNRVQRGGARFDKTRLLWVNGSLIRTLPLDVLYDHVKDFWPDTAASYSEEYKRQVLALVQERLKYFSELPQLTSFFFADLPVDNSLIENHKQLKQLDRPAIKDLLEKSKQVLDSSNFTPDDLTGKLNQLLQDTGQTPSILFSLIRIATTQAAASPGLSETLTVLGKEVSLQRINSMLESLGQ